MKLRYDEKIYVFLQWNGYDDGGMKTEVLNTEAELQSFIDAEVSGMDREDALEFVNKLHIIRGVKVTPEIKEIVTKCTVAL
jgi:hypothetical protein